jgi:hypothetical protein
MIERYIIAWMVMPFIGIVNAVIRESTYKKYVSELLAHQISTVTGILLFGFYIWILSLRWKIQSASQAVIIGIIWLVFTIGFEFLFGHYVMKNPWSRLFHDYNILEGRIWILVLVWITIAPLIFYKLHS